jgi:hypothetical protein
MAYCIEGKDEGKAKADFKVGWSGNAFSYRYNRGKNPGFARKEGKDTELLTTAGIRLERKSEQQEEQSFHYKGDSLKDLRVACIMDRFTLDSFSPECVLFELTPSDWMRRSRSLARSHIY